MAAEGKKVGDGYVELHLDDSNLKSEARVKATKVGKEFGGALNRQLRALHIDEIDLKASPADAIAAIALVKARLRDLSGDAATVEVRVRSEKALRDLTRFRKNLGNYVQDGGGPAAQGFIKRFGNELAKGFSGRITPQMVGAAAILGAIMAPTLAGILAGAVTGGIGAGGIIGGVVLAAKDPLVQQEGRKVGERFTAAVNSSAVAAFKGPILVALGEVDTAAGRTSQRVEQIFQNTAPSVQGFTASLIRAGDALTESFVFASARSAKPLAGLGDIVETVSRSTGRLIDVLAIHSGAASSSLEDLSGWLEHAIGALTQFLDAMLHVKEGFDAADNGIDSFRHKLEDALSFGDRAGTQFDITADGMTNMERKAKEAAAAQEAHNAQMAHAAETAAVLSGRLDDVAVSADVVKGAQKNLKSAQDALAASLDSLGGKNSFNNQLMEASKTAMDNLYGATIRNADANQTYEASWDALSESVKTNKNRLSVHTEAGRANRTALINLLTASGELYLSNLAAGDSIDSARRKHEARTESIRKESVRLGLNKTKTQELINTYGKIPPDKTTKLLLTGLNRIVDALKDLYLFQRALAHGNTLQVERATLNKPGPDKQFGGFATGGLITGPGTGTSDQINIRASNREYMQQRAAVDYYGVPAMDDINNRRVPKELLAPGFARGGLIAPVDTSRLIPFAASVAKTLIMSHAQAADKVAGGIPASGGATLDFMIRAVRAAFPGMRLISGFRANAHTLNGSLSYHALHRASDWPPSRPLAEWVNARYKARTKEFISPYNDLNIHNGGRHAYSGAIYRQHSGANAHDHWAMDQGGALLPGWNPPVYNGTGRLETVTPAVDMDHVASLLQRLIVAVQQVAPGVGSHVVAAARGTDATLGARAGLYTRTA